MGKTSDLTPRKIAEVKALVQAESFSNREISRRLRVSESSVRRIKKKIDFGNALSPKRKARCGRKPIFTARSDRCLKKICIQNRFATVNQIKSELQSNKIFASERTVRRQLLKINFKVHRPARKPKLTSVMKAKRLKWAKQHKDKDLNFWKSVSIRPKLSIIFFKSS